MAAWLCAGIQCFDRWRHAAGSNAEPDWPRPFWPHCNRQFRFRYGGLYGRGHKPSPPRRARANRVAEGWHALREVGSAAYTIRDSPQDRNAFIPYTTGKKVSSRWHESQPADLRDNRQRAPQKRRAVDRFRRAAQLSKSARSHLCIGATMPLAAYDLVSGIKGGKARHRREVTRG